MSVHGITFLFSAGVKFSALIFFRIAELLISDPPRLRPKDNPVIKATNETTTDVAIPPRFKIYFSLVFSSYHNYIVCHLYAAEILHYFLSHHQ